MKVSTAMAKHDDNKVEVIPGLMADQESEQAIEIAYDDLSRRDVRSLIFHLLYAMEGFDYQSSLESITESFNAGFDLQILFDSEVFKTAQAVIQERETLDEIIKPFLANWRFERIGVCTKLILRFAVWELSNTQTPSVIIINEAIELAKCFAEKDAYKFVNGILDKMVKAKEEQKIQ